MLYSAVKTKKMEKLQKKIQNDFLSMLCKTDFYSLLDACEATEDMSIKRQFVNEIEKKFDVLNVAYDENAEIHNKIKKIYCTCCGYWIFPTLQTVLMKKSGMRFIKIICCFQVRNNILPKS